MTFGEHLEELRGSLVKAIIWLGVGLCVGLFFANDVIRFIQAPLQGAIQQFNADRDLNSLGYKDLSDPEIQPLREFLMQNALVWETIYEIPAELQTLAPESIQPNAQEGTDGGDVDAPALTVKPLVMKELLQKLPEPSALQPKIQLRQSKTSVSSLKIEEPFMIWVKAGLIVGAVLASPMILYHLWTFVASGLHAHERRHVYLYMPISVVLFSSGVVLAFFLVLHYVLTFLLAFNGSMDVAVEPRLTYYVNFVLMLPLGFGIAFQLPLVMLFLQRIGLFETEAYIQSWKVAVLVIFVMSMLLTPADVTSMVALAIPLMLLYFLGILMCKFIPRGRGLGSAAYDPA
ncbi:Sec-independent protein translocase protein TatCy [Novipirellula galeiformis]|uniref:Sec-independent protein translocase protein TatC n=2 Tax=Novipirellula galeiformis TaxID=2528004 RepID=A0A5C6CUJ1_9BACT|nr:twin-arginine translocase subunit TatC [Novipirellula galeiformis]TWU27071.1 Sec-independent protein translocase protein TatCy [Novipirellula galeiformis]